MTETDSRSLTDLFNNWNDVAEFDPESTILEEGATGEVMYVILSGTVAVVKEGGRLATLGAGEVVGELSLIDDLPYSAAVEAVSTVRAARINDRQFIYLIENHPFFAIEVMRTIADRLRKMNAAVPH